MCTNERTFNSQSNTETLLEDEQIAGDSINAANSQIPVDWNSCTILKREAKSYIKKARQQAISEFEKVTLQALRIENLSCPGVKSEVEKVSKSLDVILRHKLRPYVSSCIDLEQLKATAGRVISEILATFVVGCTDEIRQRHGARILHHTSTAEYLSSSKDIQPDAKRDTINMISKGLTSIDNLSDSQRTENESEVREHNSPETDLEKLESFAEETLAKRIKRETPNQMTPELPTQHSPETDEINETDNELKNETSCDKVREESDERKFGTETSCDKVREKSHEYHAIPTHENKNNNDKDCEAATNTVPDAVNAILPFSTDNLSQPSETNFRKTVADRSTLDEGSSFGHPSKSVQINSTPPNSKSSETNSSETLIDRSTPEKHTSFYSQIETAISQSNAQINVLASHSSPGCARQLNGVPETVNETNFISNHSNNGDASYLSGSRESGVTNSTPIPQQSPLLSNVIFDLLINAAIQSQSSSNSSIIQQSAAPQNTTAPGLAYLPAPSLLVSLRQNPDLALTTQQEAHCCSSLASGAGNDSASSLPEQQNQKLRSMMSYLATRQLAEVHSQFAPKSGISSLSSSLQQQSQVQSQFSATSDAASLPNLPQQQSQVQRHFSATPFSHPLQQQDQNLFPSFPFSHQHPDPVQFTTQWRDTSVLQTSLFPVPLQQPLQQTQHQLPPRSSFLPTHEVTQVQSQWTSFTAAPNGGLIQSTLSQSAFESQSNASPHQSISQLQQQTVAAGEQQLRHEFKGWICQLLRRIQSSLLIFAYGDEELSRMIERLRNVATVFSFMLAPTEAHFAWAVNALRDFETLRFRKLAAHKFRQHSALSDVAFDTVAQLDAHLRAVFDSLRSYAIDSHSRMIWFMQFLKEATNAMLSTTFVTGKLRAYPTGEEPAHSRVLVTDRDIRMLSDEL